MKNWKDFVLYLVVVPIAVNVAWFGIAWMIDKYHKQDKNAGDLPWQY